MKIQPLLGENARLLSLYGAHIARHRAESGGDEPHFMPFEVDDRNGPKGANKTTMSLSLSEIGWQRWWVVVSDDEQRVIAHLDLSGGKIATNMHRCQLGMGIEHAYRGQGLGRRLLLEAIAYAYRQPTLSWLDLNVFAHNAVARSLYESLGFVEIGIVKDRFRIAGEQIDDVAMTLSVAN